VEQSETHRALDTVWRMESAKLIARLSRITRDVGRAEELAQEAMVVALEKWNETGVPDNPGAWLMTTAKNRALDLVRRNKLGEKKLEELGKPMGERPDIEAALDDDIGDDMLRLIFTACHPVLPTEARLALTLRLLGGLTVPEIARAFLVPEPTIAQRIVRAKKTLAEAGVPFEMPNAEEREVRLSSVLEVIYLIFNEGYSATAGDDWMRPALCEDAMRLGRVLAGLQPSEPEVHGLVALMELQASRLRARTGPNGEAVLLMDQNRALWDWTLIGHGTEALQRALSLGGGGPYVLQASIAYHHARARRAEDTDWQSIAELYGALMQIMASPVIELNRAVAVGMHEGPAAALAIVDELRKDGALDKYHLLYGVRGDLLAKLGRLDEARKELKQAAALTKNERERQVLLDRIAKLSS
jgi:RNA polymerase sigma-70 factor, ECF subfamily